MEIYTFRGMVFPEEGDSFFKLVKVRGEFASDDEAREQVRVILEKRYPRNDILLVDLVSIKWLER